MIFRSSTLNPVHNDLSDTISDFFVVIIRRTGKFDHVAMVRMD